MKAGILTLFIMNKSEFCPIEIRAREFRANTILPRPFTVLSLQAIHIFSIVLYFQREHTFNFSQIYL
jgi:hypothetical protein